MEMHARVVETLWTWSFHIGLSLFVEEDAYLIGSNVWLHLSIVVPFDFFQTVNDTELSTFASIVCFSLTFSHPFSKLPKSENGMCNSTELMASSPLVPFLKCCCGKKQLSATTAAMVLSVSPMNHLSRGLPIALSMILFTSALLRTIFNFDNNFQSCVGHVKYSQHIERLKMICGMTFCEW